MRCELIAVIAEQHGPDRVDRIENQSVEVRDSIAIVAKTARLVRHDRKRTNHPHAEVLNDFFAAADPVEAKFPVGYAGQRHKKKAHPAREGKLNLRAAIGRLGRFGVAYQLDPLPMNVDFDVEPFLLSA